MFGLINFNIANNIGDIKKLNPLTLAFVGDAVFELIVRVNIVSDGDMPARILHKKAVSWVRASSQSEFYDCIKDELTQDELDILRRGRNCNKITAPKNTDLIKYRRATAVEALIGYLYLTNQQSRILYLFNIIKNYLTSSN